VGNGSPKIVQLSTVQITDKVGRDQVGLTGGKGVLKKKAKRIALMKEVTVGKEDTGGTRSMSESMLSEGSKKGKEGRVKRRFGRGSLLEYAKPTPSSSITKRKNRKNRRERSGDYPA